MLTYLDSSVLVAWVLDAGRQRAEAERIIEEIETAKINAVTSSIAIMEVIDAIRKRITEKSAYRGDPASVDMSGIKNEIEKVIKEFLDGLTSLAVQDKLVWADPDSPVKVTFEKSVDVLRAAFGKFDQTFKDFRTCYVYRGIGQYDVQHALIAKALQADTLLTFDKAFSALSSNPLFANSIVFTVR